MVVEGTEGQDGLRLLFRETQAAQASSSKCRDLAESWGANGWAWLPEVPQGTPAWPRSGGSLEAGPPPTPCGTIVGQGRVAPGSRGLWVRVPTATL